LAIISNEVAVKTVFVKKEGFFYCDFVTGVILTPKLHVIFSAFFLKLEKKKLIN